MKAATGTKPHKKIRNRSSAHIVDGKLILSFPDALTPVLWQMDLNEAKASALLVKPSSSENDGFSLALKTTRGELLSIADFSTKEEGVEGLMAVSRAMQNAHGRIRTASVASLQDNTPLVARKSNGWKWVAGIVAALVIVILMTIWGSLSPQAPVQSMAYAPPSANAQESAGVPVSADDYLQNFKE